jgi:hypothetical protein
LVFRKKTIMTIGDVYFVMRFEIKKNWFIIHVYKQNVFACLFHLVANDIGVKVKTVFNLSILNIIEMEILIN